MSMGFSRTWSILCAMVLAWQLAGSIAVAADPKQTDHGHAPEPGAATAACVSAQSGDWGDDRTWEKGRVPADGEDILVRAGHVVTYAVPTANILGAITIDGTLRFDPAATLELKSGGNIVLCGKLELRPAAAQIRHTITFHGVNERKFRGGGMRVLPDDVGLWVVGKGVLDAVGLDKTPWTRLAGSASAGDTVLAVEQAAGWRVGDRLTVVPTLPPTAGDACWKGYDTVIIKAVEGGRITIDPPLRFDHPCVTEKWSAEVLNLTRNVVLRGTAEGRAHTIFMVDVPQTIRNIELSHLGPRGPDKKGKFTAPVEGRYALHFHHSGDGTRGSLVENVVVHDCGSRAFVPHASHGITMRGCISHDTFEDAYWWDPAPGNETHGTRWLNCVASMVRSDPTYRGYRLAGFSLRHGDDNQVSGCVAVGVQGSNSAGFVWPERDMPSGVEMNFMWKFHDNRTHNNKSNGIFVWQNDSQHHMVEKFVAFHNAEHGIEHGAYRNNYTFGDAILYGNGHAGVRLHAVARDEGQALRLTGLAIDGAGISRYGVEFVRHRLPPGQATLIANCTFRRCRDASIAFTFDGDAEDAIKDWVDVVHCTFEPGAPELYLSKGIFSGSLLTVRPANGDAYELRRSDQAGVEVPAWNARRRPIVAPAPE